MSFRTARLTAMKTIPASAKTHQHLVPKWYSLFITMGWNNPMTRNVVTAIISPVKFISGWVQSVEGSSYPIHKFLIAGRLGRISTKVETAESA